MKRESSAGLIAELRRQKVQFVQFWFSDVLGFLKGVTVPTPELGRALTDGMNFDGSSIEGFARIEESDMVARPDPSSFALLPWQVQGGKTGRMFCDITTPAGEPVDVDSRSVLRRTVERARRMGLEPRLGVELEYFCVRNDRAADFLDTSGYFDLAPSATTELVRHETIRVLEDIGVKVEYGHHEVSQSQHEIDLRYTDLLTMADNVMTARFVAKQVAQAHNAHVTFMPKPVFGVNGSGMHCHLSLFRGERNLFYNAESPRTPSPVCRQFLAGLLRRASELTLVTNQWVNSYKRLVPGYEAPVYVCWAHMNRSALVRLPAFDPRRRNAARVEYRSPDPACNPYLAFAVLLAAGLDGIEHKLRLGLETSNNIYRMTEEEREAAGIGCLPEDLSDAIRVTEKSDVVRRTLGDVLFGYLIRNKRLEWDEYKAQVTEYEVKRYLPIL